MHKYVYDGPVVAFDRCIEYRWHGETTASSEAKARSNLAFRYKQETNRAPKTNIKLPGNLTQIN